MFRSVSSKVVVVTLVVVVVVVLTEVVVTVISIVRWTELEEVSVGVSAREGTDASMGSTEEGGGRRTRLF
jgi:hypothetical protein